MIFKRAAGIAAMIYGLGGALSVLFLMSHTSSPALSFLFTFAFSIAVIVAGWAFIYNK